MMSLLKSVYMPFRRIWMDDDEVIHKNDLPWAIGMPALTVVVLVICQVATFNN